MEQSPVYTHAGLNWIAVTAMVATLAISRFATAEDRGNWLTGPALQEQLAEPVDVLWAENPFRPAVTRLSRACRVAILIDRRVDPGQKLNLSLKAVPLAEVLQTVARQCNLGVARLGPVIYLGPRPAAERLPAIAALFEKSVRRLPTVVQRKFRQTKQMAWPDLATPRELLADLGSKNGLTIVDLKAIPHDLWAAADLPPLSLIDRLTLIANQFDLTFQPSGDGTRLELVPPPKDLPVASSGERSLMPLSPAARTRRSGASQDRFSVNVREKPLLPVLRQLAARLELDLRIDEHAIEAAGVSLDQRVSVHLQDATLDDIFHGLLRGTGLTFHRRQKIVEIVLAEKSSQPE